MAKQGGRKGGESRTQVWLYGGLFVVGGLALALAAHAVHALPGEILHAAAFLVETLGVAIIALGIVNVLIETKDWRNYFEKRLQAIIVNQAYLTQLDKEELLALQTRVMKVYFGDEGVDREGSFLKYFQGNLHDYIGAPFREKVNCQLFFTAGSDETWAVTDKVSYRCRRAGGTIQQTVRWIEDPGGWQVTALKATVRYPTGHAKAGKVETLADETGSNEHFDKFRQGLPLDNYKDVDGLLVDLEAHYTVTRDRFHYWMMAHPSRGFDITITYPPDHIIQFKPLLMNDKLMTKFDRAGYLQAGCDDWMLPNNGLVWQIRKAPLALPPPTPDSAKATAVAPAGVAEGG